MRTPTIYIMLCLLAVSLFATSLFASEDRIDIPPKVEKAINQAFGEATIERVRVKDAAGTISYEIKADVQGIGEVELMVADDGTILKMIEDIRESDLPAAVKATAKQYGEGGDLDDTMRVSEQGLIYYNLKIETRIKDIFVDIAEDGTLLNKRHESDSGNYKFRPNKAPMGDVDLSKGKIVLLDPGSKILANAADMLANEIEKRTRIRLDILTKIPKTKEAVFLIGTEKQLAKESYSPGAGNAVPQKIDGYSLWTNKTNRKGATICAAGYDQRGTLFAVGRLLRLLDMERDRVKMDSSAKIATSPVHAVRGHQLGYRPKTHSYDGWDAEIWEQYYRDLIVFGTNAIELIPPTSDDAEDSPHFPKPKLEMMVLMSQMAIDYGLDVWIWFTALDKRDGKRVDYSDEQTIQDSLAEWAQVFQSLPKIDDVFVPGGDPGNTHPAILLPFMARQKQLLVKYHPKARIWVSPQNFDRNGKNTAGWYKDFVDIMQNEQPKWLDGVVFGPTVPVSLPDLRKDMPSQYPIRRYPDITHTRSAPYGVQEWDKALNDTEAREAINPRPVAYAQIFRATQNQTIGFVSYSEGCNDDFNKMLWSALGWNPQTKVETIVKEFSRYFISRRYQDKFAKGLFALEQNWVGPLKDNDGVYKTLELFQEMETKATPQEKHNWRFLQALYRAYYDAYIKARLEYETELQERAIDVLNQAQQSGATKAMDQAEAILDKAITDKVRTEWRARNFELAEALFQTIRMQHSVERYHSQRYANLDDIDKPLNDREDMLEDFDEIRQMASEQQKLAKISEMVTEYSQELAKRASKTGPKNWPDWTVQFDYYQRKRSRLFKPYSAE